MVGGTADTPGQSFCLSQQQKVNYSIWWGEHQLPRVSDPPVHLPQSHWLC